MGVHFTGKSHAIKDSQVSFTLIHNATKINAMKNSHFHSHMDSHFVKFVNDSHFDAMTDLQLLRFALHKELPYN